MLEAMVYCFQSSWYMLVRTYNNIKTRLSVKNNKLPIFHILSFASDKFDLSLNIFHKSWRYIPS